MFYYAQLSGGGWLQVSEVWAVARCGLVWGKMSERALPLPAEWGVTVRCDEVTPKPTLTEMAIFYKNSLPYHWIFSSITKSELRIQGDDGKKQYESKFNPVFTLAKDQLISSSYASIPNVKKIVYSFCWPTVWCSVRVITGDARSLARDSGCSW